VQKYLTCKTKGLEDKRIQLVNLIKVEKVEEQRLRQQELLRVNSGKFEDLKTHGKSEEQKLERKI